VAMIRPILKYGDGTLHAAARPVDAVTPDVDRLVEDMVETMYAAPGVGLAATQVNVSKRIFVMDVNDEHPPAVVINPKLEVFDEVVEIREGCLSVPGMIGEIVRYKRAAVTCLDREGRKIRIEGEGLLAQCLQHEVDHLSGALYIDRAKNVRPAVSEEEKEVAEA
jgi:peptide deformylase